MLSTVYSGTTLGLEGVVIRTEVDVAQRGLPTFTIVGLPAKSVEESKERVRTAIKNSGYDFPESKIVVNLAPADIKKEGSHFDLPIAIAILVANKVLTKAQTHNKMFVGELSLDGGISGVNGILPICISARNIALEQVYIPSSRAKEVSIMSGIEIIAVSNLTELVNFLQGNITLEPVRAQSVSNLTKKTSYHYDFAHIKGQEKAKRALEIAATGMHNIHLRGVPGAGKTLLSRALPSILPSMDEEEVLEVTKIYSVAGLTPAEGICLTRPFRSPHQTISLVGLIGGSSTLTPGEITLAHRGVLFLDEFPQFARSLIEGMRQPLEDGFVTVTRAVGTVTYPARFLLVAASNPCPCGFLGHPKKKCHCGAGIIEKYKKRLSGPILDRIDLHLDIPPVEEKDLASDTLAESSESIRERVEKARSIQAQRFATSKIKTNSEIPSSKVNHYCPMTDTASALMLRASEKISLSARSYFKVIKIARTIADLEGATIIADKHIAEALQYRTKES